MICMNWGSDMTNRIGNIARIVGIRWVKYHPHGDSSIYDALVVMAQEFKKRA